MWLLLLAFIKLAELRSCANTEINVIFHRQTDSLNRISFTNMSITVYKHLHQLRNIFCVYIVCNSISEK